MTMQSHIHLLKCGKAGDLPPAFHFVHTTSDIDWRLPEMQPLY